MSEFKNTFHTLCTKLGIKGFEWHLVLKYCGALHRYIQTEMDFMYISSLGFAYRYVFKIELKFRHQNKPKYGKDDHNNQPPKNQSKPHEKKSNGKTKKETGNYYNFHKIP